MKLKHLFSTKGKFFSPTDELSNLFLKQSHLVTVSKKSINLTSIEAGWYILPKNISNHMNVAGKTQKQYKTKTNKKTFLEVLK